MADMRPVVGDAKERNNAIIDTSTQPSDGNTEMEDKTDRGDVIPNSGASGSVVEEKGAGNMPAPPVPGANMMSPGSFKMPLFGPRLGMKRKSAGASKAFSPQESNKGQKVALGVKQEDDNDGKPPEDDRDHSEKTRAIKPEEDIVSSKTIEGKQVLPSTNLQNIPYKIPTWSGTTNKSFSLEIIKTGVIVDSIDITTKPFFVFGRIPSCDVSMEHPSVSRHHAVLQFCAVANESHEEGWYLYDLDSTHGTWLNKHKVNPRAYYRVRVGHVIKFGGSTRLYILQGPEEDQEEESELSVTELKAQRERQLREAEVLAAAEQLAQAEKQKQLETADQMECTWGMDDDAIETEAENPFATAEAVAQNEELYIEDPKKALRGYYEREGLELPEYDIEEIGRGKHKCRVELPIDGPSGEPIIAEVTTSGKKKEAVLACALEACRILDRHGVLRKAHHESRKKKKRNWEDDDYYDSDEDTFLDRTGTIEQKRQMRMKKSGKLEKKTETYESLASKVEDVEKEIKSVEEQLATSQQEKESNMECDEEDALDAYMSSIKSVTLDTKTRMKIKRQLFDLRLEEQRLRKLMKIALPSKLPELKKSPVATTQVSLPLVGKMHKATKPVWSVPVGTAQPVKQTESGEVDVEEEEEEDEEDEKQEDKPKVAKHSTPSHTLRDNIQKALSFGPTLPPGVVSRNEAVPTIEENLSSVKSKEAVDVDSTEVSNTHIPSNPVKVTQNPKQRYPDSSKLKKPKVATKMEQESKEYDPSDPDYAVWVPPKGQSGDGRTHLNDKFGY